MTTRRTTFAAAVAAAGLCVAALAGCGAAKTAGSTANGGRAQSAAQVAASVNQADAVAGGPVGKNLPDSPTLDAVRKRGYLVYAGSRSGIGFSQLDPASQKIYGFDAGMAQLLAKYLLGKPDARVHAGGADTREALLGNHTVDVAVQTYTITPERAAQVNFAGPYYLAATGIVVKSGDTSVTKPSDLAGKKVATQTGAGEQALQKEVPTAKPVLFDTAAEMIAAVEQGRVQAATLNNATLAGTVIGKTDVKLLGVSFGSSPFGIGLPKDDPAFKKIVVQFLNEIESDGTWTKLYDETAAKVLHRSAPTPPKPGSVEGS
jgi:glutamate transport system substrate-binding protein